MKKTAIYHLLQNENKEAFKYLKMARNHGFYDFGKLGSTVKDLLSKMSTKDSFLSESIESFFNSEDYKALHGRN